MALGKSQLLQLLGTYSKMRRTRKINDLADRGGYEVRRDDPETLQAQKRTERARQDSALASGVQKLIEAYHASQSTDALAGWSVSS